MPWPDNLTVDERLDDAANRMKEVADRVHVAIHLFENNRKFVFDDEFNRKVPQSEARVMLQFIQHTLVKSLILETLKVWDSPGNNRDSLPTICVLINSAEIIDRQRERQLTHAKDAQRFSGDISMIDWMIESLDRDAERVAVERHAKLGQTLAEIEAYTKDNALLSRLRDFRDRHIAHSLSTKPQKEDLPFYGDAGDLLEMTKPWVNNLLECITYGTRPWDEYHRIAGENASQLWDSADFRI